MSVSNDDSTQRTCSFIDTSTDCAICLGSLDDGDETIELTCGHRWHLVCIREQLEHAQPNHSRRLLFSGCRCAKCGVVCGHESLSHLTRKIDVLRDKVDLLVKEQLQIDAPQTWKNAVNKTPLMDEGRRKYAFYLCSSCEEPYFGGTVECADQEEGELPSEDRLCPNCAQEPQTHCQRALEHRGFHVWKCRYCCSPANHLCYGTVHFCQACHDRNSHRVRLQRSSSPPPLEAIPCRGQGCSYPKPPGQDRHSNGPSPSCEQVYYCAACVSAPSGDTPAEEPGSTNILLNPSGEQLLCGWHQFHQMSWVVERSEHPVNGSTSTNFVSSCQWCIMGQIVPLYQLVNDPSSVRIEVSAKFSGRTDCPSVFKLEAIVFNVQRQEIHRICTAEREAPADHWERVSHVIEPVRGAHEVLMVVHGRDCRYWQGHFGAKVAECSVRVLCPQEELEVVLRPEGLSRNVGNMNGLAGPARGLLPARIFDLENLLPLLLLVLAWLLTSSSDWDTRS